MFLNSIKTIFYKFVEYALYIFFILFPFVNYSYYLYTGTTSRAVNTIGIVSIMSIVLGIWLLNKKNTLLVAKSPILLSLGLYFSSILVSAIVGFNWDTSFWSNVTRMTGVWYMINIGFLLLFITSVLGEEKIKIRFIKYITISTSVYSVLALLGPEGLGIILRTYQSDGFTFGNSTFAGMYIFGAFLLSIYYLYILKNKKWWSYILPFLIIINPFIINSKIFFGDTSSGFIGEARASSIVILLSVVSLFFAWLISKIKNKKVRDNTIKAIFFAAIFGFVSIGYSLLSPDGYVRGLYLDQATGARPLVWEASTKVISDRPMFGWGLDNFERVFEKYYDNRLLEDKYGNEAWFDRAHNVFVDQVIDNGYVGLFFYILIYLVLGGCLLCVILKSSKKEDRVLATILSVYFGLHLLELQTAFDTTVSFIMFIFMIALSVNLYHKTKMELSNGSNEISLGEGFKYLLSISILIFFCFTFVSGLIPFVRTQNANGYMRTVGSSEKRLLKYDVLFGSRIDLSAFLWRTSADLQRGIGENPTVLEDSKKVQGLSKEFEYLENMYKEHLIKNPNDFRSHLNLADILMYIKLFDIDKLDEAHEVLDRAVRLVPQSPQAYWMKSVAYIYQKKFDLAREWAKKGLELNPNIRESHNIARYVEESIKTFPEIDLYFFSQT